MDTPCSSSFTAKANCGSQFDDGWLILDSLGLFDGLFHGINVVIAIFDVQSMPSVSLKTFQDVFSESTWISEFGKH